MADDFRVGQIVKMKKKHPCGGEKWEILRTGMDFRIKCLHCGRSVLLPRRRFESKVDEVLEEVQPEEEKDGL